MPWFPSRAPQTQVRGFGVNRPAEWNGCNAVAKESHYQPTPMLALALLTVAALTACGGGGGSGGEPAAPPQVTGIAVTPDAVTLEALEATAQLRATARDGSGNSITAVFNWSSADTAVATVSSAGLVTAHGNGMTTITVASGSVTQTVSVSVQQRLSRLVLSADTVMLNALGAASQLDVTPQDANGHPMSADVRWTSSEPAVATVDPNGLVTAQANGVATVTVASGPVTASASVTVQQRLATVIVSRQSATLQSLGEQVQLNATSQDANGRTMAADIDWDSSDPAVATVDADGLVTARGNGMTTVTASGGSVSMSVQVTVRQRVANLTVSTDALTLESLDETRQLLVTARDANGHVMSADIRWRSSDDSIAIVDALGLVTAKGHGTATVTAASGAFTASVAVTVSLYPAIVLTPESTLLEAFGDTVRLHARALDADGAEVSAEFEWYSSDPKVAAVDASGVVTARENGDATITARFDTRSATAKVTVRQRAISWGIEPWSTTENPVQFDSLGEMIQFSFNPRDANGHPVRNASIAAWSDNESVVVIDSDLLATAVGNGSAAITFDVDGATNGFTVYVQQQPVGLRIEPTEITFRKVDETHQFAAHVTDANGHALSEGLVYWRSADQRIAEVDGSGLVAIRGVGETTVTVTALDLTASALIKGELEATCDTGASQPSVLAVQPSSLVEGDSIRIQGTGFCSEPSGNLVTVDSLLAEVTAASGTELSVTVPQFHCLPSRRVTLTVAVGSHSVSRSFDLRPDEPVVELSVGEQAISGPDNRTCVQFSAATQFEAYLLGAQSTLVPMDHSRPNALSPVRLIALTGEAMETSTVAIDDRAAAWNTVPAPTQVFLQGATAATAVGGSDDPFAGHIRSAPLRLITESDLDTLPDVGDRVRLPGFDGEFHVYAVGLHGLWLVKPNQLGMIDQTYPGRVEALSEAFDSDVYPTTVNYFGAPDLGRIDRVPIVIDTETLGAHATEQVIVINFDTPVDVLAHELVHLVQFTHDPANTGFPEWFREGQGVLAQEVFGFAVSNRHSAQNYGREVAHFMGYPNPSAWQNTFALLTGYFGGVSAVHPQECGWFTSDGAPCSIQLQYPVGWSLLRWLTDQYGRRHPGGDAQLHREMLQAPGKLFETIERLLGDPMDTLLAQWSAALYVDDRVEGADPELQFTSWNFRDIYKDEPNRLIPLEIPFAGQEIAARIRDGSTWYLRVSGGARAPTAVRVRDHADQALPDEFQVWVVRLE